jgi:hypothetical protein
MLTTLTPIAPGEAPTPMWEVAWARGVSRDALRAHLGDPVFVETDSHCTFGGEEDWWGYRNASGDAIAVCLRVPYEDAVLCVSDPTGLAAREGASLLGPWMIEVFDEPRLR